MNGIGVCPGIAIGKAFVLGKNQRMLSGVLLKNQAEAKAETGRFELALLHAKQSITHTISSLKASGDTESIQVLDAHIELLDDPDIYEGVTEKIKGELKTAPDAVIEAFDKIAVMFENMDNDYFKTRVSDIRDICNLLLENLNDSGSSQTDGFQAGEIVIAYELSPSDALEMDVKHAAGFASCEGSRASHASIIAKMRGLPGVVACGAQISEIISGDLVILDGLKGTVLVNPDAATVDEYVSQQKKEKKNLAQLKALKNVPAMTTDGVMIKLYANVFKPEEIEQAFENCAEGVGLLRTEMLFLNREEMPDEEEQFLFYRQAAINARGKPVILRTIDIGGDKKVPYLGIKKEDNPFLGYRAIRICLARKDVFTTQLRAILRASAFGNLKIMFPMISAVEEIIAARAILDGVKLQLREQGAAFMEDIPIGVMIETPSAAVTADLLAQEVEFFSIGTNDLCQYTLAVDRMNEQVRYLYDPFQPAVLRLIDSVIKQAKLHHIDVGMCGEFASEPAAALLLMGMGLDEFSMSAGMIPHIKNMIRTHSFAQAKKIYEDVIRMKDVLAVREYLKGVLQ